jgi:hypothetical protein
VAKALELRARRRSRAAQIGVGLVHANVQRTHMVGWDPVTFGYHGDDGCLYSATRSVRRRAAPPVRCAARGSYATWQVTPATQSTFGVDDVVGCGLIGATREVFFTRNGVLVGACGRSAWVSVGV